MIRITLIRWKYIFDHWLFRWKVDEEGDLVLVIAGVFNITKYKEHAIIGFGRRNYEDAPKYIFDR